MSDAPLTEQDAELALIRQALDYGGDYMPPADVRDEAKRAVARLRAALVARDAELAACKQHYEVAEEYRKGWAAAEAELAARDAELAEAKAAYGKHEQQMGDEIEALEAEVTQLRAALAEAGVVLEVLAGQIADNPYRELSRDFQQTIMAATLTTREALNREASDTLASSGGHVEGGVHLWKPGREPEDTQATKGQVT